jgi:hypothetical protein
MRLTQDGFVASASPVSQTPNASSPLNSISALAFGASNLFLVGSGLATAVMRFFGINGLNALDGGEQ